MNPDSTSSTSSGPPVPVKKDRGPIASQVSGETYLSYHCIWLVFMFPLISDSFWFSVLFMLRLTSKERPVILAALGSKDVTSNDQSAGYASG
jgi:hypothetical protein